MQLNVAQCDDNIFVENVYVFFSDKDKDCFNRAERILEKEGFSSISFTLNGDFSLLDDEGKDAGYSVEYCEVIVHNLSSGYKFTLDIMVEEGKIETEHEQF